MKPDNLQESIKKLKDDPSHIQYFIRLVNDLDLEVGRSLLEEIADFTEKENLQEAYGWATHRLGWIYLDLMRFEEAVACHRIVCEIFLSLNNVEGIIAGNNGLMAAYATQEMWDLAIESGLKGIELAEQSQNERALKALLINTAIVYEKLKQYKKSKEMLEQVNRIGFQLCVADELARYTTEALSELGLKNGHEAIAYIEQAYELSKKNNNAELAEVLSNRGRIYAKLGNRELARQSFEEGLCVARKNNQSKYIVTIMIEWAKLDISRESYVEAIDKLIDAAKQIDKAHARRELKDIYFNLSQSYKILGQSEKSLSYMEKYLEVKDEIASHQSDAWMARLDYKKVEREALIYKNLYNQVEHLSSIGQKITAILKIEDIIDIISEEVKYMMDVDVFEINLYNSEEDRFNCILCIKDCEKMELGEIPIQGDNFSSYCIQNRKSILLNDIEQECEQYLSDWKLYMQKLKKAPHLHKGMVPHSALFIPLMIKDKVVGIMSVQSYKKSTYKQKDLNALQILGSYIAIALENTQLFKEVEYRAAYDVLTEVFNRREIIRRGLGIYKKEKETMCLVMIDIDNFKNINDTYGHAMGDEVLKVVASTMRKSVRDEDFIGRYGGEEFLIVLPCTTLEQAYNIAEQIREDVEKIELQYHRHVEIKISVSIGVTNYKGLKDNFEEMIKCADTALYQAKEEGKNRVKIYQSVNKY